MDDFNGRLPGFMAEFEDYIGRDYLSRNGIVVDGSLRFDGINFDIVDEVVTEHLVGRHFGMTDFTCDDWPDTLGELLSLVRTDMSERDQKKKVGRVTPDSATATG